MVKSITVETEEVMDNSGRVENLLEDQAVATNDTIISFEDIINSIKTVPELIKKTEKILDKAI